MVKEKANILYILLVLEKYSDCNHKLSQKQIIDYLKNDFDIDLKRKAVSDSVNVLKNILEDFGYYIENDGKNGTYLDNKLFEESELGIIEDAILSNRQVNEDAIKDIINKLNKLGSPTYREKSEIIKRTLVRSGIRKPKKSILLNISTIEEAIVNKKQIEFIYMRYGKDLKLFQTNKHTVSPLRILYNRENYYIVCYDRKYPNSISMYRLDKIDTKTLKEIDKPCENAPLSVDFDKLNSLPCMSADRFEKIEFYANRWKDNSKTDENLDIINYMVDWFGTDFKVEDLIDVYKITITTSPRVFMCWASLVLDQIEIITPQKLKDEMIDKIKKGAKKYDLICK